MVEATKEKRTDWNWSEYEPGTRETVHSPHRARGIGIGRPRLIRGQLQENQTPCYNCSSGWLVSTRNQ